MRCSKCDSEHDRKGQYYCKSCANEYARNRRSTKTATVRAYHNSYVKKRKSEDPNFYIAHILRTRIGKMLRGEKVGSAVSDLGCTLDEFKKYLEERFQSGMSWDNRGEWHIDHIKPLASFDLTDREQFLQACHYTNLQPLWAEENQQKGARANGNPEA